MTTSFKITKCTVLMKTLKLHITGILWGELTLPFLTVGFASQSARKAESYHYGDVIMGAIASQITSLTIVYSTVYSDADQRKHQSFASLAFVRGIHRGPVNFPHKWPVTREMFPFDDVIMSLFMASSCVVCQKYVLSVLNGDRMYHVCTQLEESFSVCDATEIH